MLSPMLLGNVLLSNVLLGNVLLGNRRRFSRAGSVPIASTTLYGGLPVR